MDRLIVIDGNSILNRAFYGIMGSKMLQTADGTYTNAVYGFLSIMFKILDDLNPKYLVVAFDVKSPTKRHEMYKEYKGTRKGMPDELASQMPLIKKVLTAMNIKIIEKAGYEADDVLGTLSRFGEKSGLEVYLLTGDRDSFQLATKKTIIRIPRTKQGKTEEEDFDEAKVLETYGVKPVQLIEVKGLMGDTSDNIPGVPGIGEKTALNLIKEYESVDNLYKQIEDGKAESVKGKTREKIIAGKDSAILSRELGRIDVNAPIDKNLDEFKLEEWNRVEVLNLFRELRFNRYIERFNLEEDIPVKEVEDIFETKLVTSENEIKDFFEGIKESFSYKFEMVESNDSIVKQKIKKISSYKENENTVYSFDFEQVKEYVKKVFENEEILKIGYKTKIDYILLKEQGIEAQNLLRDVKIAGYLLNSATNQYGLDVLAKEYLDIEKADYLAKFGSENNDQTSLFDEVEENAENYEVEIDAYLISKLSNKLEEELKNANLYDLYVNIEMPTAVVLANMQYDGVFVDELEIIKFGEKLKKKMEELRIDIYRHSGKEFNVNSTKQLGEVLFEDLKLPVKKKTKTGYSTDSEVLEKLKDCHPIISVILEYRKLAKLSSTYVDGMIPFINEKTGRIHTYFHQTVASTGRLSSTDPNLQNIPTRTDLGKRLRKVFKPEAGNILIDADYSQVELRVLAHMSKDEIMCKAFNEDQDIHTICASQIFDVPVENVSKQLRSRAKAVNFGIVYGISEFGLAEQTGINMKEAKNYIDQYLEKYHGIKEFMDESIESAKRKGYAETLYHRRRYIAELNSNNFMVRKFGERVAMNTPVQGTAADIMKIAMINVYKALKENNMKAKIVLQVHDELLVEAPLEEEEKVKEILVTEMENAAKLDVPLKVEALSGKSWFQAK